MMTRDEKFTRTSETAFAAAVAARPQFARFRGMPVAQELTDRECMLLFSCFGERHIPAGETVYEVHTPSDGTVHLILEGSVAVVSASHDIYTRLGPGDVFGLFSFLDDDRPHSATVVAERDLALLTLGREYFDVLTIEDPALGNLLLRFMFRLLSRTALKLEVEYAAMHEYALARRV